MQSQSQHLMVTAGTSPLGRAVLQTFAANGYRLSFTCSPGDPEAKALQAYLHTEFKVETNCMEIHPSDPGALTRAENLFSSVDALVNCFEPARSSGILEAGPLETNQFMDRRFYDLLVFTRAVAVHMLRRKCGDIVNIGLANAPAAAENGLLKTAAAGIEGITEAIRMDLFLSNIRVAIVQPDAQGMREEDIANAVYWTIRRPRSMSVHEIVMSTFPGGES